MRIVITGGAGFIGSHLVDKLIGQGNNLTIIDNFYSGERANIARHADSDRLRVVSASVLDWEALEPIIAQAELVFHLAAVVGLERVCPDPVNAMKINILGTDTVFQLCRKYKVKVVLASSSEAYGKSEKIPLSEGDDTILGNTRIPRWSYALSKLTDEEIAYSAMRDIPVVILRFFNAYGPRVKPAGGSGVIARFIDQALNEEPLTVHSDGEQGRSYTYIEDTIAGVLGAAGQSNEIFNIGNPKLTTINELAGLIKKLAGSSSEIIHIPHPKQWGAYEETRKRVPDIRRARNVFGFQPQVSLEDGLRKTIDWARGRLIEQEKEAA